MDAFLDTNIFLSFYHLSSDDLEELKKLVILAREEKIVLHVPEQVIHEFRRNRANKIADAIKRLKEQKLSLQFPQICKQYEQLGLLRKYQQEYKKAHARLLERMEKDAVEGKLEADFVVEELLGVARVIPVSLDIVERAHLRASLGNPPGKKGSLGDAVNWETLLEAVSDGKDLYFIADDGDYFSPLDKEILDPFLQQEWSDKKGSKIYAYRRLSDFLRDHFGHIALASELEKDLLIEELMNSPSFADTHRIIAKLSKFSDFTPSQVNAIVFAATINEQIYWIARDEDVHDFLSSVVRGREEQIDPDNLRRIQYVLNEIKPFGTIPDFGGGWLTSRSADTATP